LALARPLGLRTPIPDAWPLLHPSRRRGSRKARGRLDSRLRGNDIGGAGARCADWPPVVAYGTDFIPGPGFPAINRWAILCRPVGSGCHPRELLGTRPSFHLLRSPIHVVGGLRQPSRSSRSHHICPACIGRQPFGAIGDNILNPRSKRVRCPTECLQAE